MTPGMPLVDWSPLVLSAGGGAGNSAPAPLARVHARAPLARVPSRRSSPRSRQSLDALNVK
jgi:hypothetical protein